MLADSPKNVTEINNDAQPLPSVDTSPKRRKNSVTIGLSDDGVTLAKILGVDEETMVVQFTEKLVKETLANIRSQVKLPF